MAGENLLSVCVIIWIVPHRFEQLTYTGLSSHPYDSRLGEFSWDNQWKLLSAILEVSVHTHMEEKAESQYPFLSTKLLPPLNEMQLYLYKLCIPWWYISISEKVREGTTRGRHLRFMKAKVTQPLLSLISSRRKIICAHGLWWSWKAWQEVCRWPL